MYGGGDASGPVVGWRPLKRRGPTVGEKVNDILAESELSVEEKDLIEEAIIASTRTFVKLIRGTGNYYLNNM